MEATEKPLAGKRIVVTRAPEQSRELVEALERMGAEVLLCPMISFAPPEDPSDLDAALLQLSEFDWILFTSRNAVGFVSQRLRVLGQIGIYIGRAKVAAVGSATAQAAKGDGWNVHYIAADHTGTSLAKELCKAGSFAGKRIFLPRSDRAEDKLPVYLRNCGAGEVLDVIAYRTLRPKIRDTEMETRLLRGAFDAAIFASPSAFYNFRDLFDATELVKLSKNVEFAVIGPTTARALSESGVRVGIETQESSSAGLANAIASHYQGKTSTVRHS